MLEDKRAGSGVEVWEGRNISSDKTMKNIEVWVDVDKNRHSYTTHVDCRVQNMATTHGELNAAEQENILRARLWARGARSIAMPNMLTREFVEQLHLRMYGDVPDIRARGNSLFAYTTGLCSFFSLFCFVQRWCGSP